MINEPFLRTVMTHIENNLSQWDQDDWQCCLAGTTVRLAVEGGYVPRYSTGLMASQLLGLNRDQAERLFYFSTVCFQTAAGRHGHRHPTYAELRDRVQEVTGVDLTAAPVEPTRSDLALAAS